MTDKPLSRTTRKTYTLEFKLKVLDWLKANKSSVRGTARQFGIHRRMIQRWLENERELNSTILTRGSHCKKLSSARSGGSRSEEIGEGLAVWYESLFSRDVTDKELAEKAREIAARLNQKDFKVTPSWLRWWKKRNNIRPAISATNSTLLAHTDSNDSIRLFVDDVTKVNVPSVNFQDVYFDYTTPEHNYCKPYNVCNTWPADTFNISIEDDQTYGGYEEIVENIFNDTPELKVVIETDTRQRKSHPLIFNSFLNYSSTPTDGVLSIGNRLSEPFFSLCPEIVFLNH